MIEEVSPDTTFSGRMMAQTWSDLQLYERLLNIHPLKCIIELGTGQGGFSYFLHAQCLARGLTFHTFDLVDPNESVPGFSRLDIFQEVSEVVSHFQPGGTLLICDNGDKPRELKVYAPLLQPEDLLAVHDWGSEVVQEDVPDILLPIHEDWTPSSITRFFVRSEDDLHS